MAVVADDLTGACSAALQYFRGGHEAWVAVGPHGEIPSDATAIAVNTDSRQLDSLRARMKLAATYEWLKDQGVDEIFKVVDPCLRGNLRDEIDELLLLGEYDLALVAPANPKLECTTVGGVQLLSGVPVSLTLYGEDALYPVSESHLPTLLEAGHLDYRAVSQGWSEVAGAIAATESRILVVDAARTQDLSAIAEAIRHSPRRILPVGSAGLAHALQTKWLMQSVHPIRLAKGRPVLVVNGSVHPASLDQVDRLSCRVLELDLQRVLLADFNPEEMARRALQQLFAGQDVAITVARSPLQASKALELGRELGMDGLGVADQLTKALEAIAQRLISQTQLGGLILVGGQTSQAICQHFGGLRIVEEFLPSTPLGTAGGLRVIAKSGGFGKPDLLNSMIRHLKERP